MLKMVEENEDKDVRDTVNETDYLHFDEWFAKVS